MLEEWVSRSIEEVGRRCVEFSVCGHSLMGLYEL